MFVSKVLFQSLYLLEHGESPFVQPDNFLRNINLKLRSNFVKKQILSKDMTMFEEEAKLNAFMKHMYYMKYPRSKAISCLKVCIDPMFNDRSDHSFEDWAKENLSKHDIKVLFLFCECDSQEGSCPPEENVLT